MRYCDLTLAYTATSGGIRTYVDQKRKFLAAHPKDTHILIVPGEHDEWVKEAGQLTVALESPIIPGCAPYRMFTHRAALFDALVAADPDVIELGSYFISPKPAFDFRELKRGRGENCLVSGYFHTDLARAYFGAPVREAFLGHVGRWSETIAGLGANLGNWVEWGATNYFGNLFSQCDVMFAATEIQAQRLREYGVQDPEIVPLGTDLQLFHPNKRKQEVRLRLRVDASAKLAIYVGRQDAEKQCQVLVDAVARLKEENFHLLMIGDGPMHEELLAQANQYDWLHVQPFESNKERLAEYLAAADVYVTAGAHETFGLAVVEAQASGLPTVGVEAGALIERVPESVGRLGPVGDAEAMSTNLLHVIQDRERFSANARRHVEQEGYGWERSFEKLLGIYNRLGTGSTAVAAERDTAKISS